MQNKTIVIDDGSNYIKVSYLNHLDEIITSKFESRVIRKALPSIDGNGYSSSSFKIGNNYYSVASSASQVIPTNNNAYQYSEHNRVLVHHALKSVLGNDVTDPVDVVVTLPIGAYFNLDGSPNEAKIADKVENIKGEIEYLDGTSKIKIDGCYVLPESIPAFVRTKEHLKLKGDRHLIVDVGGTTTDIAVITSDNQIEQSLSLNVGALATLTSLSRQLCNTLNLSELTDSLALSALLTGSVLDTDVSSITTKLIGDFTSKIDEAINSIGEVRIFNNIVLTGGGSSLIKLDYPNIVMSGSPQFDNVLGALNMVVK